jgi:hypothetical protein
MMASEVLMQRLWERVAVACRGSNLTPSERLVAIHVALRAEEDPDEVCRASQTQLAEDTGLSERAVRYVMASLEGCGVVTRGGRSFVRFHPDRIGSVPVRPASARGGSRSVGLDDPDREHSRVGPRFTCRYCGRRPRAVELQVDHVVPEAQGGKTTERNLVTACTECNAGKADG